MNELKVSFKKLLLPRLQLYFTLILIIFFSVTGATYAYLVFRGVDNVTINGQTATVNLTLNVSRVFPTANSDNTGVLVPQLSVSGSNTSPLSSALKSSCVDGNKNVVCQVYKIDIQNIGGTATQVVDGSVNFYGNTGMTNDVSITLPNLRWKLITSVDVVNPTSSVLGTNEDLVADATGDDNVFATEVILGTNDIYTYYMIIWINETEDEQSIDEGNSFYGLIEFNSSNGTGVKSAFGA